MTLLQVIQPRPTSANGYHQMKFTPKAKPSGSKKLGQGKTLVDITVKGQLNGRKLHQGGTVIKTKTPYEGPIAAHTNVKPGFKSIEEILAPSVKTKKGPGGRPQKEWDINWQLIEELARIHCTGEEISQVVNVPYSALREMPEFSALYKKAWEEGKASLRRLQWQAAGIQCAQGKSGMLVWLGKQWLGQMETVKHEHLGSELGIPDKPKSNLDKLSRTELEQLKALLEKANHSETTEMVQ